MKGTTVTLYDHTITSYDPLGNPIIRETPIVIENVLVGEPSTDDIATSTALYQKQIQYMLGIPKGDTHDWMDKKVKWKDAYGRIIICKTFGYPITGIEANIPGPWHMKIRCERYG